MQHSDMRNEIQKDLWFHHCLCHNVFAQHSASSLMNHNWFQSKLLLLHPLDHWECLCSILNECIVGCCTAFPNKHFIFLFNSFFLFKSKHIRFGLSMCMIRFSNFEKMPTYIINSNWILNNYWFILSSTS